jgi:hypothetical protein
MTSLDKLAGSNIGGAKKISICPIHLVESINESSPAEVTFKEDGQWFDIYTVPDALAFSLDPSPEAAGDSISASIDGKYPNDSETVARFFEQLGQYKYFIVKIKDHQLVNRLVGTLEYPMQFFYKHGLGASAKGFRGYTFQFKGKLELTPPRILD